MKIRFEITIEDMVAFNRFHHANSPTTRRQRWMYTLLLPLLLGLIGVIGAVTTFEDGRDPTGYLIFWTLMGILWLAGSVAWFFFSRWHWARILDQNVRKLYAEGTNRALLGWREMELVDGRLFLKTELIHSSMDLRAIEKIIGTDEYTFVYIASLSAYLIPMNLYPEEEYREFVAELRDAWENRGLAPPPLDDAPERTQPDYRIVERPR